MPEQTPAGVYTLEEIEKFLEVKEQYLDDWVILRITKRDSDGSLMLEEVIGRKK